MISLSHIWKGIQKPRRAALKLIWIYQRKLRKKTGVDIVEKDWDNLIIMDACRYDLFESWNTIEGDLSPVISKGSNTAEFLRGNFKNKEKEYNEIVYISGNPQTRSNQISNLFHKSVPVWQTHWDEELQTVLPNIMCEQAQVIHEKYPNKRLIIHFVQPHYPFIGETGREIEHRSIHGDGVVSDPKESPDSIWRKLEKGDLSKEKVWKAYRENLQIVLPHIQSLVDELNGKTVITSDHGNAFGEFGLYGHPEEFFIEELVQVPWLEIPETERKFITKGEVMEESPPDELVEERLSHLGYR